MTVDIVKGGKRVFYAAHVLSESNLQYKRLVLLPIPSTKDGIRVNGTDVTLESLCEETDSSCAVCGYGLPSWFSDKITSLGGTVYDALYDENFQQKNADLTAIGVLGEIISEKGKAPSEVRFGVIGYGRIGSLLVKYLSFLGASPVVFSSRESVRHSLGEWGIETLSGEDISEFSKIDVLINTAPKCITDKQGAELLHNLGVSLFDLASGENFGGSECVMRLPAVPDRVFPESAGYAYAQAICKYLGSFSDKK